MRCIDADALNLSMMSIAPGETKKYCYPCREILKEIDDAPTIEPDWTELMVICDNCGHAIHVKRTDAKPAIEPERKTGKWIEDGYNHHKAVC